MQLYTDVNFGAYTECISKEGSVKESSPIAMLRACIVDSVTLAFTAAYRYIHGSLAVTLLKLFMNANLLK